MNLYRILYDVSPKYVQAEDFAAAVQAWKEHVKELWGDEYEGNEQPESVELIHNEPVILAS